MPVLSEAEAKSTQALIEQGLYEMKKVIVGQAHLLERLILAVMVGGHVLVEGAPGLAKTLTLKCLSQVMSVDFQRLQFTPDLLPSDLLGTRIYNPGTATFKTELGPIFANFILADEINRAPAKVQSALLEAMQEHQVTIGTETFDLEAPFLVMATQNPIESEGTYALPEAQLDRFLMKLVVDYPSAEEEFVIIQRHHGEPIDRLTPILSPADLERIRSEVRSVYLDPQLMHYIVTLVNASRKISQDRVLYGASPRGSLSLASTAQARALMQGRTYVTPQDIEKLAHDCLRHRIILSYQGLSEHVTTDQLIDELLSMHPIPVLTGK